MRPDKSAPALKAPRNVGRIVEHGYDAGRLGGAIGNPIAATMNPGPARAGQMRIRPRRWKSRGRVCRDLPLSLVERRIKGADRLDTFTLFVMIT